MHLNARIILFSLLLLVTSHASSAGVLQEIGIEAGPNYGFLDYDNPMEFCDPKWAWGFTGGVLFKIPLSTQISVVPELRYSQLRNKILLVNSAVEGNFSIEHNSISVPLLLRYEFIKNMCFSV